MSFPNRDELHYGEKVLVELKQDQGTGKLTQGIIKTKLTSDNTHPHGIKVELQDGSVGRVKKILFDLSSESKTTSDFIPKTSMTVPEDEDSSNEFKSSFRADIDRLTKGDGRIVSSKSVEKEISITISAMANKEGGELFIGINDDGGHLGRQNFVDGEREHSAVLFGEFHLAAWQRILIGSAAAEEQRGRAGMPLLQIQLREPGVVTAPLIETEHRVMAGISEDYAAQL